MKKIISSLFIIQIVIFIIGCEKKQSNTLPECSYNGVNEEFTEVFNEKLGKVVLNHNYTDYEGNQHSVYAITIALKDLNSNTWIPYKDSTLVPCNLPDNFKENNLLVVFSGNKSNCCDILTHPQLRTSYGCKLELTDIKHFEKP